MKKMDFSTKIQKLRNNSKLTQEQLTQTIYVSRTFGVRIDIQTRKFESSGIIIIDRNGGSVYEKRISKT